HRSGAARQRRRERRHHVHGRTAGGRRAARHRSRSRHVPRPDGDRARYRPGQSAQQPLAVGTMTTTRRRVLGVGLVWGAVAAGAIAWHARRLPVAETRQFLTAPIVVGNARSSAPSAPANPDTLAERETAAHDAFAAGDYPVAADHFAWVVA